MILYFTHTAPTLPRGAQGTVVCPDPACEATERLTSHLCFASAPLAGRGGHVFSIDVPEQDVQRYRYQSSLLFERDVQLYAIPGSVVETWVPQMTRTTYEAVTGNPWNRWIIPVLDKRKRYGAGNGFWGIVWMSRPGIAAAKVHRRNADYLSVEVTLTQDFDPTIDYLAVEEHEETERTFGPPGVKETFALLMLAGKAANWITYPRLWKMWVESGDVQRSASQYLHRLFPELKEAIRFAETVAEKHNKVRAWRQVADAINTILTRDLRRNVYLGKFAGHSWTAVMAMPLRIAMRIGGHLRDDPWEPPIVKPERDEPDRIALANLYGAYPQHGPGVDHDPLDRPHEKLEGELRNQGKPGFSERQPEPVAALA